MSTLIEPIKADIGLSDSAIGFLTGTSLAIFYVTAGFPLGDARRPHESPHHDRARSRRLVGHDDALRGRAEFLAAAPRAFRRGCRRSGWHSALRLTACGLFPASSPRACAIGLFGGRIAGSAIGSSAGYASDAWGWSTAFFMLGVPGVAVACWSQPPFANPSAAAWTIPRSPRERA